MDHWHRANHSKPEYVLKTKKAQACNYAKQHMVKRQGQFSAEELKDTDLLLQRTTCIRRQSPSLSNLERNENKTISTPWLSCMTSLRIEGNVR